MEKSYLWSKLAHAVFTANLPDKVDVIFVHAFNNLLDDLLERAAVLSKQFGGIPIIINGASEYEDEGRGAAYARTRLETMFGISPETIVETVPALQTYAEAQAFADYAGEHSIKTAIILTLPPHLVRAYLTDLFVLQSREWAVQLIPQTIPVDWNADVTIAGLVSTIETTSFVGRVFSECARIVEYRQRHEAGDVAYGIATIQEGLLHARGFSSEIIDRATQSVVQ